MNGAVQAHYRLDTGLYIQNFKNSKANGKFVFAMFECQFGCTCQVYDQVLTSIGNATHKCAEFNHFFMDFQVTAWFSG